MRRNAPRRAVLLVATLALSTIAPGFFAPVQATDLAILQGSIRSVAGEGIAAEVTLLTSDGTLEGTSSQHGDTFVLHSEGGPHILRFAAPSTATASSATLPATWSFEAPYLVDGDDLDIDVTLPDAAPADIVVLGLDGQPVSGTTMTYSAVTEDVDLGAGLTAQAIAAGDVADDYADGNFAPLLFGKSTFTFTLSDGSTGGPFTVTPGTPTTLQLGRPSVPQNVTATAGDGKVKVTWEPPVSDGGSPITGYTVTASRNSSNVKASFGPSATSGTIRSLLNGKTYSVTVVAKNANGSGISSPKISVTLPDVEPPPTTTTTAPPLGGAGTDDDDGPGTTAPTKSGYWLLDATGVVYPFGDAAPYGDPSAKLAAASAAGSAVRAVDLEPTPSMKGYWVLDSRGRIHPFGDAPHLGDVAIGRLSAGEEPATLSATPSGAGYWVFTNRGQAIAFGDATALGDMTGTTLNGPVLDSVATPSGQGYYMVASDGGIFAFGDARFAGSMGGKRLNAPVRSLVPDGDGTGYWLVAADGGVFAFDAPFVGSMGGRPLNKPVQGMVRYGNGYLMVAEDGGVFAFSDLPFTGSLGASPPASPIVSVAALT
ncbi:MAG TPA: fibronectin type III domain-containing protein [Acidimicrobiia bacterium]|nr:fibronectin type III domain-containing protein [Acidimicrobiia bacterium]